MTVNEQIERWFSGREDELVAALAPLIAIDSTSGQAQPGKPFGPGPAAALAAALEEAFNLTPEESRAMGDRGRSLIMETYASPQVAASMKRLYRYLLGQEPKPEFVDLS